ncbi:hypothetical protein AbraIFM66951_006566 [Aspergillus brasiliensis]|uniref:Heterokaryon incompatibility domain-containing protein n=1 Tax=Aspergillus brasiliensis TaxID=319629 RepID=A0A9W5YKB2_9EURO|nr:hypothetical protein AbraCBS73388_011491 [Aspergillus brasiliensis]GKZ44402.1 hypothetical protein AbraIFM66951_006566 [Aspergillus brasiliensis]
MAPPACRYATLSYVWGRTTDTCALATTSTIQALEEEGYLFKKPLPATIRDSILACSELRIRYLWIDRLCIVQDDTSTVRDSQINAMGDIYSHSYLTLVDLEGISMDHGLPGVSQARPGRMVYEAQGMSLRVKDDDIHHTLVNSKWGSRGWTFQEAMLSPRTLLFTDVGVHFECSQAAQEDRFAQLTSKNILFTPAQDYHMLVHDFTSRTLTLNADVLRAFSGIMHWKYGTEQYFGLPYCGFVESMLWCPRTLSDYETTVARSAEAGDIFPTWSWSSIMGPIRYPSAIDTHTLLGVWGIPSFTTGELVHIIRPHSVSADPTPQWNKHTSLRGLGIALAWKEGCFPEPLPPMLNVSTPWKGYEALIRSGWESVDKLNEEALGIASIQGIEDFERIFSSSYREHADRPGTLLAHTQSLRARVVQCEEVKDGSHWRFWYVHTVLHSMHGDKVDVWIQSNPTHWQFLNHDYSKDHCTKLDVLALTMCDDRNIEFAHLNRDEEGRWYDSEGGALCLENGHELGFLVNVLIVETRDGLSRRVAIGVVELHHWISASPEFRDFSLI